MLQITTEQIAQKLSGTLEGPGDLLISGLGQPDQAERGEITFIRDERHARLWTESQASAALVARSVSITPGSDRALIHVDDADGAVIHLLRLFTPEPSRPAAGVHPGATIDPTAEIGSDVRIGPGCVIDKNCRIGDGCTLHGHVTLMAGVILGPGCDLAPGVVIKERCEIGSEVIIQPNAVIGSEGFGFVPTSDGSEIIKIPHIGIVRIGDGVEIGAGTCIDRGKFSATIIGAGTKIDNLCQIGHNCVIGSRCIVAGQAGLAGTVTLGDEVMVGGKVGIKDHVKIGHRVRLAASSMVMEDIPDGETWGGYPAREVHLAFREYAAIRKLPELTKLLRKKSRSASSDEGQK